MEQGLDHMVVAFVESWRWRHGDLQPASLPVDRRLWSDPSPAPRSCRSGREPQMAMQPWSVANTVTTIFPW